MGKPYNGILFGKPSIITIIDNPMQLLRSIPKKNPGVAAGIFWA
jgi:hypothetical protein